MEKSVKVLILAAGYGTRMYPLTKQYPKPLLKVKRRPIIDFIVDSASRLRKVDEIIVITNSKFFPRFKAWQKRCRSQKRISVLDDLTMSNETRRGAVGDVVFAVCKKKITGDLLVIGGDNLFDGDLQALVAQGVAHKAPAIGVHDVGDVSRARLYGVVKLNARGRVVGFAEKPKKPASTLVGMCVYYFPKETLGLMKKYLGHSSQRRDATGKYIAWLSRTRAVYGYVFGGSWCDIGDHACYDRVKHTVKR